MRRSANYGSSDGRDQGEVAEEIGDLLLVIVNLARRLDVEPETALKTTNRKFPMTI